MRQRIIHINIVHIKRNASEALTDRVSTFPYGRSPNASKYTDPDENCRCHPSGTLHSEGVRSGNGSLFFMLHSHFFINIIGNDHIHNRFCPNKFLDFVQDLHERLFIHPVVAVHHFKYTPDACESPALTASP